VYEHLNVPSKRQIAESLQKQRDRALGRLEANLRAAGWETFVLPPVETKDAPDGDKG
jgi:uroporphyrinogen-III synthase